MNIREHMIHLAKAVMIQAYSPYSHFSVGACIRTEDDQFFSGCNIENVSYSLTLCAEASAIAPMIAAGCQKIAEVAVTSSGDFFCPPCGACRQRLSEFALPGTLVHMCDANDNHTSMLLEDLLPSPFNEQHLRGLK